MTTLSEAIGRPDLTDVPVGAPAAASERARTPAPARARVAATERDGKISRVRGWISTVGADIRSAWWAPASLPTLRQAWAQRMPDHARVPGDNHALYIGWAVYNHGIAVPLIAAITGLVGVLGVAGWVLLNPARLGLALVIAAPIAALIFS